MYFQRTTGLAQAAASSSSFRVKTSTETYFGLLHAVEYVPGTVAMSSNSSGFVMIRRGSTTGEVIFRSSSKLKGTARDYWYPRVRPHSATAGQTRLGFATGAVEAPLIWNEKVVFIMQEAGTSAPTAGGGLNLYIQGQVN